MLIKALMLSKESLVTVSPDDSIELALQKINEKSFLSIPVVSDTRFVGVISKQRIYEEYFEVGEDKEEYLKSTKVSELTRYDIPVLKLYDEIEKASYTLEIFGVPFVAIVDDNEEFQGIITHHAIFREFADIFGINRGKKLSIISYDIPGQIAKLAEVIHRYNGDIISLVILDPKVKTDVKEVVVRLRTDSFVETVDAIRNAGFRVQ